MASPQAHIASFASTLIRVLTYIFLRWIPGHPFPHIIFALAAIYATSFAVCALRETKYELVAEEVDVTVKNHPNGRAQASRQPGANASTVVSGRSEDGVVMGINRTFDEKDPQIFRTLLAGLPSPSSPFWTAVTFLTNALLLFLVCKLTFQAAWFYPANDLSFARVGYVSHNDARIFVREPDTEQYPLYLSYRHADHPVSKDVTHRPFDSAWHSVGGISALTEATDYTITFTISDLRADTRYQYALSSGRNGHFITGPKPGFAFEQSSETHHEKFTFMHTSCVIPNFPFNVFAHPLTIPGFRHLAPWLSKIRPAFMLFLGDFIYVDVPYRHGSSVSDYRRAYRQVYASPEWPSVASVPDSASGPSYDVPWLHVYDDHEIGNDWDRNTTGVFPAAFDPYLHYHLAPDPPLAGTSSGSAPSAVRYPVTPQNLAYDTTPTWSMFTQGPATFFLLDTRRYRTPANLLNPNDPTTSILGDAQVHALKQWLVAPLAPGVHWRVVISSVPFTKNWRVNSQDTWSGYLYERRDILEIMWKQQVITGKGIVVLSGDRHEFAATAIPPPPAWLEEHGVDKTAATVHEFSNSPLSQFYLPFQTYREDSETSTSVGGGWLTPLMSRFERLRNHLLTPAGHDTPGEASPPSSSRAELLRRMGAESPENTEHDIALKYLPAGNSKFGIVDIESPTSSGQSLLRYRAVIDGKEAWSHVLVSGAGSADVSAGRKRGVLEDGVWG